MGIIMNQLPLSSTEAPASSTMGAAESQAFKASVARGLAQLDAGEAVSGGEVDAWVNSWFTETELSVPAPRPNLKT